MFSGMTSASRSWAEERNLSHNSERETLIYILGRVGREEIPQDLLLKIAEYMIQREPDVLN